mgnify:CR=1 FL=1
MKPFGIIDGLFLCAGIVCVAVLIVLASHAVRHDMTPVKCHSKKCEARK